MKGSATLSSSTHGRRASVALPILISMTTGTRCMHANICHPATPCLAPSHTTPRCCHSTASSRSITPHHTPSTPPNHTTHHTTLHHTLHHTAPYCTTHHHTTCACTCEHVHVHRVANLSSCLHACCPPCLLAYRRSTWFVLSLQWLSRAVRSNCPPARCGRGSAGSASTKIICEQNAKHAAV